MASLLLLEDAANSLLLIFAVFAGSRGWTPLHVHHADWGRGLSRDLPHPGFPGDGRWIAGMLMLLWWLTVWEPVLTRHPVRLICGVGWGRGGFWGRGRWGRPGSCHWGMMGCSCRCAECSLMTGGILINQQNRKKLENYYFIYSKAPSPITFY